MTVTEAQPHYDGRMREQIREEEEEEEKVPAKKP